MRTVYPESLCRCYRKWRAVQAEFASLNLFDNDIEDIKYSDDSIYITLSRQKLTCPCCGSLHLKSKGFYTRNIKTPNQLFACYSIYLRIRRYSCPECGHSFGDDKHLAPPHNSVSYNVIFEVMKLLRDSKMTFNEYSGVAEPPNPEYGATSYPVMRARHSGNESHMKIELSTRETDVFSSVFITSSVWNSLPA